jgi:hypothetical protein
MFAFACFVRAHRRATNIAFVVFRACIYAIARLFTAVVTGVFACACFVHSNFLFAYVAFMVGIGILTSMRVNLPTSKTRRYGQHKSNRTT